MAAGQTDAKAVALSAGGAFVPEYAGSEADTDNIVNSGKLFAMKEAQK